MFDLYLAYQKWKSDCKLYIISRLNRRKDVFDSIIDDIIQSFNNGESIYKIHLMNAPIGELGLDDYIDDYTQKHGEMSEQDLHYIYYILVDSITTRFALFPSVKVISHNKGSKKYLEVYRKNYKQIVDKDIK